MSRFVLSSAAKGARSHKHISSDEEEDDNEVLSGSFVEDDEDEDEIEEESVEIPVQVKKRKQRPAGSPRPLGDALLFKAGLGVADASKLPEIFYDKTAGDTDLTNRCRRVYKVKKTGHLPGDVCAKPLTSTPVLQNAAPVCSFCQRSLFKSGRKVLAAALKDKESEEYAALKATVQAFADAWNVYVDLPKTHETAAVDLPDDFASVLDQLKPLGN